MPRIKRWSPISHDFNRDSQIIALRQELGDWTALAWQEVLHEGDRNDGIVMGSLAEIAYRIAPISLQKYIGRAANVAQMMLRRAADNSWILLRRGADAARTAEECDRIEIANHWKYHRTPERRPAPSYPNLTNPNLIRKEKRREDTSFEAKDLSWPSPQLLIEKYNSETPDELSAVSKLTPARLAKARAYLKIFPDIEFWSGVFSAIGESNFLRGLQQREGQRPFIADYDWLLSKGKDGTENVIKVYERKYDNNGKKQEGSGFQLVQGRR